MLPEDRAKPKASQAAKPKSTRKDISIMTLLANEATEDARKILQKFGKQDASGYADLEAKLGEVYFKTPDKQEMERDMVAAHPHKKWMLRVLEPELKAKEITKEPKKEDIKGIEIEPAGYTVSNASGQCDCPECMEERSGCDACKSSADGVKPTVVTVAKNHTPIILASILGVTAISITALVLYYKLKKKA